MATAYRLPLNNQGRFFGKWRYIAEALVSTGKKDDAALKIENRKIIKGVLKNEFAKTKCQ